MSDSLTVEVARVQKRTGLYPAASSGRLPRITRLMALAIRCQGLIADGMVANYADLACFAGLSRARVTQIMNLLNLAPDIQERLLFLPTAAAGRDSLSEQHLRGIAGCIDWQQQRRRFSEVCSGAGLTTPGSL
jgi:hypothetical protein